MWQTDRITSWSQFQAIIESMNLFHESKPTLFFRGQANADWALTPSLTRLISNGIPGVDKSLGIEFGAFRRFRESYKIFSDEDPGENEHVAWWVLMQHYSCPTRLLDWSLSPYVATYFAVCDLQETDAALWCLSANHLEKRTEERYGSMSRDNQKFWDAKDGMAVYPFFPTKHSVRSHIQQGVFTISSNLKTIHSEGIAEAFPDDSDCLPVKFSIDSTLKLEFMARLHSMNISAASLFPGIDGLGRTIRDHVVRRTRGFNH